MAQKEDVEDAPVLVEHPAPEAAEQAARDAEAGIDAVPPPAPRPAEDEEPFGQAGRPMSRNHPLYIGFFFAIGALVAYGLVRALGEISQVITLIVIAAFLAMGLDPVVRGLQNRGLSRGWAVFVVFVAVILVFVGFLAAVLPTVVTQASAFSQQLPDLLDSLRKQDFVRHLDEHYGIITKANAEITKRLSDGDTVVQLFGGILGAGKALVSGFVSAVTVLVLTLYFLASLHNIADIGYRLVPSSRRQRVRLLGDEIIRRIGGYVAGQSLVATINAVLIFIVISIFGLPFTLVLAITVGLLGLIPLVGATLGGVIVVLVGLFQDWRIGVAIAVYYLIYQQVENYLISPRIMSRTVQVPGAVALIAALAGGSLLGILGALIAIPVAAAVLLILQEVVLPRQQRL